MWSVVHNGGDCWRQCGECGWWCIVVVIVRGDVVNVVDGAWRWRLSEVIVVGGACWW